MFCGGAIRDVVTQVTATGALGEGMAVPFTGYSVVYHVEMLFLFITLIAIGPLVQKNVRHAPELGLAKSIP